MGDETIIFICYQNLMKFYTLKILDHNYGRKKNKTIYNRLS
jgi:hypothetical protein